VPVAGAVVNLRRGRARKDGRDRLAQRGDYQAAIDAWQRALDGDGDSITRADVESKIKSARQKNSKKK